MKLNENHSLKELERLKRKIEKQIEEKKSTKVDQLALYEMIKKDHEKHRRQDGRKVFRGVVDYLECYVNGLPPVARAHLTQDLVLKVKGVKSPMVLYLKPNNCLMKGRHLHK